MVHKKSTLLTKNAFGITRVRHLSRFHEKKFITNFSRTAKVLKNLMAYKLFKHISYKKWLNQYIQKKFSNK